MKKEKRLKRMLSLLLTVIMAASLVACGKKTDNGSKTNADSKNYVYSITEIPIDLGTDDISEVCIQGDTIYALAYNYIDGGSATPQDGDVVPTEEGTASEETSTFEDTMAIASETVSVDGAAGEEYVDNSVTEVLVGAFQMDGTKISDFKITLASDSGMNGFTADTKGNIYMVLDEYGKNTSNPDNVRDLYTLISYNNKGEENWRATLGENIGPDDYYYVNQIMMDKDDNILVKSSTGLEFYSSDAKKINEVKLQEDENGNLVTLKDGTLAMISYGDTSMGLKKIDLATGKLSDSISFPFNAYAYSFYSGTNYDLYLVDSAGIYGYNLGEENYTKIMDYVDSDIMASNIYNIRPIDDTTFFGTYYDDTESKTICAKFTKVDPSQIKDQETLTLGCLYLDSDIRKQIIKYNKSNSGFRIKVTDYSTYNTDSDYMAGQNKMNTDIAAGNMPDILITNSSMPTTSYISKGLFADMNTFFENDSELKREDYLDNVWNALSKDGKLYQIAPSFYVFTVFGKTSVVGSESGWTLDDLTQLMSTKGEDVVAFNDMTRDMLMNYSMWLCNSQFIDWNSGKCSFDSEGFIKLLEFANQYPKEINYPSGDDNSYWENYQTMYREDRALLMPYTIASFEDYNTCEQGTFGEEITPIGFPTDNKNGSALNFNTTFAISGKSKNQQAAWDFVRYFLTDDYQANLEWCLPVKRSQIEALAEKAQKKPTYTDEKGNQVEYDNTFYLNGAEVTIPPMTKEKANQVITFVESVDQVMNYDTSITDIITEETAPYFEGQKSAQEVADIIQSRVQIYVNENR